MVYSDACAQCQALTQPIHSLPNHQSLLYQFTKAARRAWRVEQTAIGAVRDFGHIEIAARVDGDAVGRSVLVGPLTAVEVADTGQLLSAQVVDGDTSADVGEFEIDVEMRRQLTDIGQLACDVKSARTVQVVPLGEVVALIVEDLHPMVFTISHVDASL